MFEFNHSNELFYNPCSLEKLLNPSLEHVNAFSFPTAYRAVPQFGSVPVEHFLYENIHHNQVLVF